ncbi:MAG TPA: 23S rRNA (pseudouridine(1915)-N(3))-methyltransferase RlmH [Burkholderiales bacterium]|nr:23S rRNA (pseudouridine(1915)-N(3))-methyltransferase RlmH [Burkholderiales bacterium]
MRFVLCSVGHRVPAWVSAGFDDYARRMPREMPIELIEIRAERRPAKTPGPAQVARILAAEGARIRAAIPPGCLSVALDQKGKSFTTGGFAHQLEQWRRGAQDVAFMIGSADGLDPGLKQGASLLLSLSSLTLPHQLVRVLLAEQLYRGVSLLHNHPYHRE